MSAESALRAQLAAIRPGDEVTVRLSNRGHDATLTGVAWEGEPGWLRVGSVSLRWTNGDHNPCVVEVVSHTTALPPEPPINSFAEDRYGHPWRRYHSDGWGDGRLSWAKLHSLFGPIRVIAHGVAENEL